MQKSPTQKISLSGEIIVTVATTSKILSVELLAIVSFVFIFYMILHDENSNTLYLNSISFIVIAYFPRNAKNLSLELFASDNLFVSVLRDISCYKRCLSSGEASRKVCGLTPIDLVT